MEDVLQSMEQPARFEIGSDVLNNRETTEERNDLSDLLFPVNVDENIDNVSNNEVTTGNYEPEIDIPRETLYNFTNYAKSVHSNKSSSTVKSRKKEKKRLRKFCNALIKQSLRSKIRSLYGHDQSEYAETLLHTYDKLVKKNELDHIELTRIQLLLHQEAAEKFSADEFLINILSKNINNIPYINCISKEDMINFVTTFKATCLPYSHNIVEASRTIYANEDELKNIIVEEKDYTWKIVKMVGGLFVAALTVFIKSKFLPSKIKEPIRNHNIFRPIPFNDPLPISPTNSIDREL